MRPLRQWAERGLHFTVANCGLKDFLLQPLTPRCSHAGVVRQQLSLQSELTHVDAKLPELLSIQITVAALSDLNERINDVLPLGLVNPAASAGLDQRCYLRAVRGVGYLPQQVAIPARDLLPRPGLWDSRQGLCARCLSLHPS